MAYLVHTRTRDRTWSTEHRTREEAEGALRYLLTEAPWVEDAWIELPPRVIDLLGAEVQVEDEGRTVLCKVSDNVTVGGIVWMYPIEGDGEAYPFHMDDTPEEGNDLFKF